MTAEHLIVDDLLPVATAAKLASRCEAESGWKLHEAWFFSQYDVTWARHDFGRPFLGGLDEDTAPLHAAGRRLIEAELGAVLGDRFTIIAHKLEPGQVIGIHNDSPGLDRGVMECFRLIYYVDETFKDDQGGHLCLFASRDEDDMLACVRPYRNVAVLLPLSDFSYHAVSKVRHKTRYSVVVSYWGWRSLHEEPVTRRRVTGCLEALRELGLEWCGHSGTTFIDHLYQVYRLLACWEASPRVCLAGLMHSVLGRPGVDKLDVSAQRLAELAGEEAAELVARFAVQSGPIAALAAHDPDLFLLALANAFDQMTSADDFEDVEALFGHWPGEPAGLEAARAEMALRRARLDAPLKDRPVHHGV